MFLVTAIIRVDRTENDRVFRYGEMTVEPVVAAFYDIHVQNGPELASYSAEVRHSPHGEQLDWSDSFQDLLMLHAADFPAMNQLLHRTHCGELVEFPVPVGRPNNSVRDSPGFYPVNADTSKKADHGQKGVSCPSEESSAKSSSVRPLA